MNKFNVSKQMVLTGLSAFFGVGAFIVDVLSKKNETTETAKEAAKIVMESLSKK